MGPPKSSSPLGLRLVAHKGGGRGHPLVPLLHIPWVYVSECLGNFLGDCWEGKKIVFSKEGEDTFLGILELEFPAKIKARIEREVQMTLHP